MSNINTQFKKGSTPWNKGTKGIMKRNSGSFLKGMSPWHKGKKNLKISGEKHWNWKGGRFTNQYRCSICDDFKSTKVSNNEYCMKCSSSKRSKSLMGNKNSLGHIVSDESKKKMSLARINSSRGKNKDTRIEKIMEELLIKYKLPYKKQVPLCGVTISDFYLEGFNIAIFCDGCYWHGCKTHRSVDKVVELNKKQNSILRINGVTVFRFWEHDLLKESEKCITQIMSFINLKINL